LPTDPATDYAQSTIRTLESVPLHAPVPTPRPSPNAELDARAAAFLWHLQQSPTYALRLFLFPWALTVYALAALLQTVLEAWSAGRADYRTPQPERTTVIEPPPLTQRGG
jgi:hypothetical protein